MPIPRSIPVGRVGSFRRSVQKRVVCPRCLSNFLPIGHAGALSRADNETEVCSLCGVDEALDAFQGHLNSVEDWPVDTRRGLTP